MCRNVAFLRATLRKNQIQLGCREPMAFLWRRYKRPLCPRGTAKVCSPALAWVANGDLGSGSRIKASFIFVSAIKLPTQNRAKGNAIHIYIRSKVSWIVLFISWISESLDYTNTAWNSRWYLWAIWLGSGHFRLILNTFHQDVQKLAMSPKSSHHKHIIDAFQPGWVHYSSQELF